MSTTGVILAGGKSSRMGQDKSLLTLNNRSLIQKVVSELEGIVDELLIVSNAENKYGFPHIKEISDIFPGMGPLAGIHAGLTAASGDYSFVTACDLPFFDGRLARFLLEQSEGFDIAVPRIEEHLQPLFAVYSKECLAPIEVLLKKGIGKIINFYPEVRVNYVDEDLIKPIVDPNRVFFNVNTLSDYNFILKQEDPDKRKDKRRV